MSGKDYDRFKELTFAKFRELAQDRNLSRYQKIGFPNSYRENKEGQIFFDITTKLTNLNQTNKTILDIGPGCSDLPNLLIEHCRQQEHNLILIDSAEMLDQLPDASFITKIPAYYPDECIWLFEKYSEQIDVILTYSVIQYVFDEANIFKFLDKSLSLLADGGQFLIGDIPNVSKRKRFFSSNNGIKYHQNFTGTTEIPTVTFNNLETDNLDDAVILALLTRSRNAGFDAYLVPQADELPMANRREDILIRKP